MGNSSNSGFKWTLGIIIMIFAALFTLAIVFDWFGWRDGEPKDRVEPITPEMVADGEVAPGASVEQVPEGELIEQIPAVTEDNGSVIVPDNPKIYSVLGGKASLIEEDGQKNIKIENAVEFNVNGNVITLQPGDVITNAEIHHDNLEGGTITTAAGQTIPLNGIKIKLK